MKWPCNYRCGTIAIVGRPNVGKSTLLNALIEAKISITSRKAQTTRYPITGIQTMDDAQLIYVDTPGFQTRYTHALNKAYNRSVVAALSTTDLILFVVEAGVFSAADRQVVHLLPDNKPCILVINKIDRHQDKTRFMPFAQELAMHYPFCAIVPISAKQGFQLHCLRDEIKKLLPQQPPIFDADEMTDRSERFLAAELVREKLLRSVGDELPYTSTVIIEQFEQVGQLRRIFAAILVERASHKAIVIGKNGARLKAISIQARHDMERLLNGPVYLRVWVKVDPRWAEHVALDER